ncbi:MAG: trigger factor [Candidatus Omnitrophica bacterium]|nr:trigger factor [Candidatus Omnitrophota bacterium]
MGISVKLADIAPCQKEVKVEIPLEQVEAEFEQVYQELKKVARVPGFRVGSAPRDLLERYHGQTAREHVLERLVSQSLEEVLGGHRELNLVGRPQVTKVSFEPKRPLSYSATIEVAPEIPLGPYKKLKLTRPPVEAGQEEEQVQQVLARLQEQSAQLQPIAEARPTRDGDVLLVDLTEEKQGASPVKKQNLLIQLNLQKDPKGFLKQLVGIVPGDERIIKLEEGGRAAIRLKEIKTKELPALDDDFAKTVGPFESLENLKESIRGNVRKEAQRYQKHVLEQAAGEKLLESWKFDVPPSIVASQARRFLKDRAIELMNQGVQPGQVQEQAQVLTDQAKMEALKQVKLFFILRQIASKESIGASEEEMEQRIQGLAASVGVTPQQMRADLEQRDLLDELKWGIIRSKVFDLVIREADIKEK